LSKSCPNWAEVYQTITREVEIEIGKKLGKDKKTICDYVDCVNELGLDILNPSLSKNA